MRGFTLKTDESNSITYIDEVGDSNIDDVQFYGNDDDNSNDNDNDNEEYMEENKYHKIDANTVIIEV